MILKEFENIGGVFQSSEKTIKDKLNLITCFVFDWDGVFNSGIKSENTGSNFSEADSMGLNMLRFSYWLKNGKLPKIVILTGENNQTAITLAKREHFDFVRLNAKNKKTSLSEIQEQFSLKNENIAFTFDDIIDLGAAQSTSLNFLINRSSSPLFKKYVTEQGFCDYITGNEGGNHSVREVCELIIGISENYMETISNRMNFSDSYQKYLAERNSIKTIIKE